jgi:hypothetical protein
MLGLGQFRSDEVSLEDQSLEGVEHEDPDDRALRETRTCSEDREPAYIPTAPLLTGGV